GRSSPSASPWGPDAEVLVDLAAEEARLSELLSALDDEQWSAPSLAPGWSIADVVLHLAQSEELVLSTLTGLAPERPRDPRLVEASGIDAVMEQFVQAERGEPAAVPERWESARHAALDELARADPAAAYPWAATPLRPRTRATTRLAEHWAHGLDVTEPLGVPYEDTARLRHVARLGHRTLPYAFAVVGENAPDVRCELDGPSGERWSFGDEDAPVVVRGPVSDFCRVGARRVDPASTGLRVEGPQGKRVLELLRNYAA
ncbi:MAG TPA: DinB family protein, partial [Thermoplasmata archaeon]|nr:DinB family protein [Thermoplasmata archaeon]